jgi:hypothetical protein
MHRCAIFVTFTTFAPGGLRDLLRSIRALPNASDRDFPEGEEPPVVTLAEFEACAQLSGYIDAPLVPSMPTRKKSKATGATD